MVEPKRTGLLGLLILGLWLGGCVQDPPSEAPTSPEESSQDPATIQPTVTGPAESFLLLTLDTTRADHLEPYSTEGAKTPHLQRLARRGGVFEQAWAVSPVTLPSHASVMTGRLPFELGIRNNGIHYLSEDHPTLAEVLRQQGFRTGAFVSAAVLDRRYGLDRGFEVYDDDFSKSGPRRLRLNAERSAQQTVNRAIDWLAELQPGERFFLWVHLFDPHAVYEPPEPWKSEYEDRPYDGEIAYMDAEIGRLLQHPKVASDQVMTMALADHGESLGEHGEETHAMLIYESTLRIPWLVAGPGIPSGQRWLSPVSQVDLFATALDMLGFGQEDVAVSGLNLAVQLRGGSDVGDDRLLYAETLVPFYTYGWSPLRSVRRGSQKYIEAPSSEFYDLTEDPRELENLAADRTARISELAQALESWAGSSEVPASTLALDSATLERLRSLGYLTAGSAQERAQRPDPKEVIQLHTASERAQFLFLEGRMEEASKELRGVLRVDPENLVALGTLARVRLASQDLEAAGRLVDRALNLEPTNLDLLVLRSVVESSQGELEAARETLDAALALDPRWLDARQQRIRILAELGEEEAAASSTRQLLEDEPGNLRSAILFAEIIELSSGELEAAEQRLRSVVEREPDLADGWRVLGRVLEAGARWQEALDVYRQGLEQNPRDGRLHARMGTLLARSGQATARQHLDEALRRLPSPPASVHHSLARLAIREGQWVEVERQARRALEIDPELSGSWNQLAVSLEEQGKIDEALGSYQRALEADPENWQAAFNQGLLLRRSERFQAAARSFEQVLSKKAGHSKSHFELGVLYAGPLGDLSRAIGHFEAVLATEPQSPLGAQARELLRRLRADRRG